MALNIRLWNVGPTHFAAAVHEPERRAPSNEPTTRGASAIWVVVERGPGSTDREASAAALLALKAAAIHEQLKRADIEEHGAHHCDFCVRFGAHDAAHKNESPDT